PSCPHQTLAGQARSRFLGALGALAVDDRSRRARFASFALAGLDVECVMDALQRAVPIPQHEVGMCRALRRQILRQRLPLAARREHIEDRVENFADVHLAPTPTALSRRDRRFEVATAEPRSVLVATTYSKSVLRVAAEEIANHDPGIAYFPSYEIITGQHTRGRYFASDLRSVTEEGVARVMALFLQHYTEIG